MKVYPIFLNNLRGVRCVVVGGGPAHEVERKVEDLLACEADVTVISPDLSGPLQARAEAGALTWIARGYVPGDLRGAFLVIVTETNPTATEPIWQEAQAEKALINAMDDVAHCTFVAGSVVRRGPLTISISTSGAAPALSVRIRQHLEEAFGPEYAEFLEMMHALRAPMAARYPDFEERRARWYELVDAGIPDLLRQGRTGAARRRIEDIVGPEVV